MQTNRVKQTAAVRTMRQLLILVVVGAASTGTLFAAAPTITSISPTAGPPGATVTITGANFGSTKGTSTVQFNGAVATTISSWSSSSIKVIVPTAVTTGPVVVTVGGVASNGVTFTLYIRHGK